MSKKKAAGVKKAFRASVRQSRPPSPAPIVPPLIAREPEAAVMVGMSKQTLRVLRSRGGGPKFCKLGLRRVGYLVSDLEAWARSRPRFVNTSEASVANTPAAPSSDPRAVR